MAKYNRNAGKEWTSQEKRQLSQLANQNTPTRVIGLKLGRPEGGVRSKASELECSMRHSEIQIYRKGTHNSDQKTHLLDHLFMRWFVILGSNPRRFIISPKNGGDLCAHRAGGGSTYRIVY